MSLKAACLAYSAYFCRLFSPSSFEILGSEGGFSVGQVKGQAFLTSQFVDERLRILPKRLIVLQTEVIILCLNKI